MQIPPTQASGETCGSQRTYKIGSSFVYGIGLPISQSAGVATAPEFGDGNILVVHIK
jgi:hypothetical protein